MSELQGLQSRIDDLRGAGVRVVAISPDTVEQNAAVVERFGLAFPILSDTKLSTIDSFRLRHVGGSPDGGDVPRPATYIVGDGVVQWRDLTDNWRIRPRPDDLIAALGELDASRPAGN